MKTAQGTQNPAVSPAPSPGFVFIQSAPHACTALCLHCSVPTRQYTCQPDFRQCRCACMSSLHDLLQYKHYLVMLSLIRALSCRQLSQNTIFMFKQQAPKPFIFVRTEYTFNRLTLEKNHYLHYNYRAGFCLLLQTCNALKEEFSKYKSTVRQEPRPCQCTTLCWIISFLPLAAQ